MLVMLNLYNIAVIIETWLSSLHAERRPLTNSRLNFVELADLSEPEIERQWFPVDGTLTKRS